MNDTAPEVRPHENVRDPPLPRVIRWFRFSEGRGIAHVLLRGALLVAAGNLLVAAAVVMDGTGARVDPSTRAEAVRSVAGSPVPAMPPFRAPNEPVAWVLGMLLVGILVTASGPGLVIWTLGRSWDQDQYLALHQDGVRYAGRSGAWFAPWGDIATVGLDEAGALKLVLENGEVRAIAEVLSGTEAKDAAALMRMLHRKAAFGLDLSRHPRHR